MVARPIIADFEKQTGIKVRTVFDSESTKSVGLATRIVNERQHPRADVFWNGEFSRTIFLQQKGVLAAYRSPSARDIPAKFRETTAGYWTGYACRARVLAFNPKKVKQPPRSLFDLTKPEWKGRTAICDPLIGTAASWASALYVQLGQAKADAFFDGLRANKVKIVPGNSVVADLIVKGLVDVGVTDTDDVFVRKREGKPIDFVWPDADGIGTLVIPATVAMTQGAPHPPEAKQLIDYLLSRDVEQQLSKAADHMAVRDDARLSKVRMMKVSLEDVGAHVDEATRRLKARLGL